jgi:methionyl-tRNA synthetase
VRHYFVKQEYFSFFLGYDILEFHALFYNSIILIDKPYEIFASKKDD